MTLSKSILLLVGMAVAMLLSLCVGDQEVGFASLWQYCFGELGGEQAQRRTMIIEGIRLPRTLAAIVVGMSFGLAGALLQAVTRNRLAETELLGINGGAALAIVLGITSIGIVSLISYMLWSFCGALCGTCLVVGIAGRGGFAIAPLRLVLTGLAMAATFQGLISYLLIQGQHSLDQYRFWVLGSLAGISMQQVYLMLPPFIVALFFIIVLTRSLAAMRLGDDVARSLGHSPSRTRLLAIFAVTLLTGSAIALSGPVILLGLIAPFLARFLADASMHMYFLAAALVGAAVLLFADAIARVIVLPYESPISVVVVLLGAPILIYIARSPKQLSTLNA